MTTTNQMHPAVLTAGQVAQRLCCHPKTVRTMCRDGRLRAIKLGSEWRVPVAALEAFVEGEVADYAER